MFSNKQFVVIGVGMTLVWLFAMTFMLMPWIIEAWPTASSMLCKGDSCSFQGWLSALGGWAAIIAAYFTVKVINRQIETANRHQRENLEVSMAGRMALARRLIINIDRASAGLEDFSEAATGNNYSNDQLTNVIDDSEALLDIDVLRKFATEIGGRFVGAESVVEHSLEQAREILENGIVEINGVPANDVRMRNSAIEKVKTAQLMLKIIRKDAEKFISIWQPRFEAN